MSNSTHDLFDFFRKANHNISDEYARICRRVNEDPGTAGDQGEENWKELPHLRQHGQKFIMRRI